MKKSVLFPLKLICVLAMLSAVSIILGKYLAIRGGDILRFSFENLPILFAGLAFGPLAGGLVGVVADLIGCVMVGYTINPIVTLGAMAIGIFSGASGILLRRAKLSSSLTAIISVALSHLIGSVLIKTFGLATFYDMPLFVLMLWRLLNYIIVGALEGIILVALFKNKELSHLISEIKPKAKRKDTTK